jgi:hypothetical protein
LRGVDARRRLRVERAAHAARLARVGQGSERFVDDEGGAPQQRASSSAHARGSTRATGHHVFADLLRELGVEWRRAVRFHEEWQGDDPTGLVRILDRVLELEPTSAWAFERLAVTLTVAGRWDELFAHYDRVIAEASRPEKLKLLGEAAQVARDVAGKPDRAIHYLLALQKLSPGDAQLAESTERMLERNERWPDLAERAQYRLSMIGERLGAWQREQKRIPTELFGFMERVAEVPWLSTCDPWLHRVRFTPRGDEWELRSAGPDALFHTADDVHRRDMFLREARGHTRPAPAPPTAGTPAPGTPAP